MKKLAVVFPTLLLAGCLGTTAPVVMKFPNVNSNLMTKCPAELKIVANDNKDLTEILTVVADNYKEYYDCKAKVDDWIFWYTEQKKIYEKVK